MSEQVRKPSRIEIIPPDPKKASKAADSSQTDANLPATRSRVSPARYKGIKYLLSFLPGVTSLVALWIYMLDDDSPTSHKISIFLSILYLIYPGDLISEMVFGPLGFADDLAVFLGLVAFIGSDTLKPYRIQARRWLRGQPIENPAIES